MNILYLGSSSGTSLQRAKCLIRMNNNVDLIDPMSFLESYSIITRISLNIIYRIGPFVFEKYILKKILSKIGDSRFDLIWVDLGELLGSYSIKILKNYSTKIINFNHDDPFGFRDKKRFSLYLTALPFYDLVVVIREQNVLEAINKGAKKVFLCSRSADEVEHNPIEVSEFDQDKFGHKVVFVGTWMPERGPFIYRLIQLGVPISIYGDRWNRSKEWSVIKNYWQGPSLHGSDYVKVIKSSCISLCLLSEGNRDYATTRTAEIPFIGGLLCAKRTVEHENLFLDNIEAVFWDSADDCAQKCFSLLNNPNKIKLIAAAGFKRCRDNNMVNEAVINSILNEIH